jgi:hypothetical protein
MTRDNGEHRCHACGLVCVGGAHRLVKPHFATFQWEPPVGWAFLSIPKRRKISLFCPDCAVAQRLKIAVEGSKK